MRPEPDSLAQLVRISRYAGGRFDLVQAGGGNASVKLADGRMLIKASGCLLSEVSLGRGWVGVDNVAVRSGLSRRAFSSCVDKRVRESMSSKLVKRATVARLGSGRPSIETVMHSVLARFTLHTHPLVVNAVTCRRDWKAVLGPLFDTSALVDYRTPGIDLALEVGRVCVAHRRRSGKIPKVFFLQNHGLIVSSDDPDEVVSVTEAIAARLERHLSVDMRRFKAVTILAEMLWGKEVSEASGVVVLSEDAWIRACLRRAPRLFFSTPFCPDGLVYCGVKPLLLDETGGVEAVARYRKLYRESPKVLVFRDNVYFQSQSVRKAREVEEVFKFHLSALKLAGGEVRLLGRAELAYLGNWESENYRQKI